MVDPPFFWLKPDPLTEPAPLGPPEHVDYRRLSVDA
jgi:hypothetical protein